MTKLEDILGRDKISIYDAGQLMEHIGGLFKRFENSVIAESEYVTEQAQTIVGKAAEFAQTLKEKYAEFDAWVDEYETRGNDQFVRMRDIGDRFRSRVTNLPPMPGYPIPYNLKELIEIAERFDRLDDRQWFRVVELAKALASKEGDS